MMSPRKHMGRIRVTRVTRENRQAIGEAGWAFALQRSQFTYQEIAAHMRIAIDPAMTYVRGWEREGAVRVINPGLGTNHRIFEVTPGYERPVSLRLRSPEENLWTAMRRLRSFTPTDLAAHATTDTVSVPVEKAGDYCRFLLAADYVRVARKADPSRHREAIYTLARETGPQPPREKRVRALWDPNTDQIHVIGGVE